MNVRRIRRTLFLTYFLLAACSPPRQPDIHIHVYVQTDGDVKVQTNAPAKVTAGNNRDGSTAIGAVAGAAIAEATE